MTWWSAVTLLFTYAIFFGLGFSAALLMVRKCIKAEDDGKQCSCGHYYGPHHPDGVCKAKNVRGEKPYYKVLPCTCHYYDGPAPLPQTWNANQLRQWDGS